MWSGWIWLSISSEVLLEEQRTYRQVCGSLQC